MVFVMFPIVALAVVGLAYAWVVTYKEVREAKHLAGPHVISLLGVLAVTLQAPLPVAMLYFVDPPDPDMGWFAVLEVLLFLVAVPCALKRSDPLRWLLVLASLVLLAFSGMIFAASRIRFG